jgi:hypothetical protein
MYIPELSIIHNFQQHIPLVLVKVFRGRVHWVSFLDGDTMIVGASVRSADDHDRGITLEKTIVANGRFQQMTVFGKPDLAANRDYHFGRLIGGASVIVKRDSPMRRGESKRR